ncbi:MAG: hypothetical protein QXJ17_03620 [Nitrososphaeria archaeon]
MLEDELLKQMIKKSSLTRRQLECLIIQASGQKGEHLDDKISKLYGKKITKPAFVITRERAKKKIKTAFYTLIITNYLSLIARDCFLSFDRAVFLLKDMQGKEVSNEQIQAVMDTLEGLINRILLV